MHGRYRGPLVGIALLALLVAGLLRSPAATVDRLRTLLYLPLFPAILAGLYLLRPFVSWPITALSLLVGYRYGIAVGLPVALAGAVATSVIPYAAARYAATDRGLVGLAARGCDRYFAAVGDLRGVVAARLAPTPAEAISGAAGMAGVPVPAFVLGTALGELPWTVAAVVAGSVLPRLDAGSVVLLDPRFAVAGTVAAGLLLAGPAYRRLTGTRSRAE